ncbi:MAG: SurA N-terminal domain-containing protein [Acidobacteriota bacterium]
MAMRWLRDQMKYLSWVLWLVILVFIGLVFFEWGGYNQAGGTGTSVATTVGGESITVEDLRQTYRNIESYYRQIFQDQLTDETLEQLNLPAQALNQEINNKILLREARTLGLDVTDKELGEAIRSYPAFQDENGRFVGRERYIEIVRRNLRRSPADLENEIRDSLMLEKLDRVLATTVYISEPDLETAYREQNEKASIRYLQLPIGRITDVEVSDAELQAYYEENKTGLERPEERQVEYLLVDALQLRRDIEVPESEIQAYYEENIESFTLEEQVRARHILILLGPTRTPDDARNVLNEARERIALGEDFGDVARELSEDPDSKDRGGDLGYFGRAAWSADFVEAVFGNTAGTLIGPIQTQYGMHLIEVLDQREGGPRPLEQVTPQIRARLVGEQSQELAESKARELATRIEQEMLDNPAVLESIAGEEDALSFETTEPFGATDVVPGIGQGEFSATAFALGEPGAVSAPVKIPRGWAILRLAEIRPPRIPELDEVSAEIRPQVMQEKQKDEALARLARAKERLASGEATFELLAEEFAVTVATADDLGRRDRTVGTLGAAPELLASVFQLEVGAVGEPKLVGQNAVLYEVSDRQTFDATAFADARDDLLAQQRNERLQRLQQSLVERRRRDLDIIYNPEVLQNLGIEMSAVSEG